MPNGSGEAGRRRLEQRQAVAVAAGRDDEAPTQPVQPTEPPTHQPGATPDAIWSPDVVARNGDACVRTVPNISKNCYNAQSAHEV